MKFFHVYNEEYFEGLVKNNLINKDSGFKIQHVFSLPKEKKFNQFAAKGTKFHSFIKEGNYPFYVDRIAGGVTYHEYPFDKALIDEYVSLLGDWFLGFQHHESASNLRQGWDAILKAMDGDKGPYDVKLLTERMSGSYAITPDGEVLPRFAHGTPEVFAKKHYAESVTEYIAEVEDMYRWFMNKVSGHILPCDSYFLFTKMQLELGMNTIMPEVGAQIPQMRIAVSLARGMAEQYRKSWGTYYECWYWNPVDGLSMPCFNSEPGNEWYLTQQTHPDDFTSFGKNGGSSRLLQKRICYYSLMAGADYFAEEWGLNCSYSDMKTFELSDYGKVKKEFIDDALRMGSIKAEIPFAIVLPCEYACVQLPFTDRKGEYGNGRPLYMDAPTTQEERKFFNYTEEVLRFIYGRTNGIDYPDEAHVITNSRFGDLFDIIYEDAKEETLRKYSLLIDASIDSGFADVKKNSGLNIVRSTDFEKLGATINATSKEVLPCIADSLHWLLSRDENGNHFVSVFNNEGNHRSVVTGDTLNPEANARVKLTFKKNAQPEIVKASSADVKISRHDDKTFCVDIPAAGFVILKY